MEGESVYTSSDVTEDLTAAAMWGDVQLLEGFLANGANPNLPNSQGNTALHVACYYGERECASVLLNYKGNMRTSVTVRGVVQICFYECHVLILATFCIMLCCLSLCS